MEDFVWQFASQHFFQPVSKLIHIKIICSKIRNTNSKSYLEVYFNIWFYRFIMYYVLTKVELISKTSTPDTNFPSFFPPTLEFWNLVFFLMIFVIEMSFDAMLSYANWIFVSVLVLKKVRLFKEHFIWKILIRWWTSASDSCVEWVWITRWVRAIVLGRRSVVIFLICSFVICGYIMSHWRAHSFTFCRKIIAKYYLMEKVK